MKVRPSEKADITKAIGGDEMSRTIADWSAMVDQLRIDLAAVEAERDEALGLFEGAVERERSTEARCKELKALAIGGEGETHFYWRDRARELEHDYANLNEDIQSLRIAMKEAMTKVTALVAAAWDLYNAELMDAETENGVVIISAMREMEEALSAFEEVKE